MRALIVTCCVLALAVGAVAQAPADGAGAVERLSRSAAQEMARSIEALDALRGQIAAEKVPLAQELTVLEEKLAHLRGEHDRVTRLVDEGNLEITNIKAEVTVRKDELTYVSNILDEYARSFEGKINVSELQYCGDALEAAKEAAGNASLSMAERFARQIALAGASLDRLIDAIGGMRFAGVGVDLEGRVTDGQFAIVGPVALFHATSGAAAGLVVPQSGSTRPLIRPLDGALQAGIAAIVQSGEGLLPLDPSRGGALQALVQKTSLIHIFRKGGPIMWPLLFASILALGTVIERVIFLAGERMKRDPKALEKFFAAVAQADTEGAIRTSKATKFYVVRALGYALAHKETSLAGALLYAQAQELKRFQRGIPILDTVITLAPLLGLLGTVTGMMGSFSLIGGELGAPGAITGGIAEALIATAFGLGIAITALLPFNFLNTRLEDARHELESAAAQLELLMHPQLRETAAGPNGRPAPSVAADGRERARAAPIDDEALARQRELQRQRIAIQNQIADLQAMLEEQTAGHDSRANRREVVKE
jgi:biopolymer transport protein ExbB